MIANSNRILWLPESDARNWDYESGGWAGSSRNPAGVRIDAESALRATVVLACVRVLSASVAGLPLHLYRRLAGGGKELARDNPLYRVLHTTPNDWQTSYEWRETLMLHLLLHGNAFCEIRGAGDSRQLIPLHPSRMKVDRLENGRLRYTYREDRGSSTVYSQDAVMHLRWLSDDGVNGMVPVEIAGDAIGLARACEIHGASFFGNGARPGVVLTTDQMLSPEAAENTRNQWERAHRGPSRAQRTAVLQGGLKISEVGGNNQEAQFLEARRFQVEEVCRIYGVPGHLVGDLTRSSFSNIEQQSLDYLANGLMPWLRRFESAISRDLLTDDETFAEFDVRGALRADAAGRSAFYGQMAALGVFSVNEIRGFENLNPVDGGDIRVVPLNMQTLEQANAAAQLAMAPAAPVVEEIVTVDETPAEPAVDALAESAAPEEPQVADVSLNGAQITGLLAILQAVSTGVLTKSGAAAAVAAAFPAMRPEQIDAILAGVPETPAAEPVPAAPAPAAASLPASRAMTVSIDFDRTFAADPALWGEFARKAVADGNTVVMVSRRPDTPENQQEVSDTLGDYREAFAQVLLVGDRLKDEAAREAGVAVDVWVDDSPQFVRAVEGRAEPGTVAEGDFVSWGSAGGRARGRIGHIMDYGTLDIPGTDFTIDATEEDPAALITVYEEVGGGWRPTETQVGHKVSTLTKIDPLPEPPAEENAYGKPKRKPGRRKRGG